MAANVMEIYGSKVYIINLRFTMPDTNEINAL